MRGAAGGLVDYAVGATAGQATATVTFVVDDDDEPPNRAPVVEAGPSQSGSVFQRIQFNGSASDADGDAFASIVWNFGDGNTASGSFTPGHVYEATGDYTVTLTVTDEHGAVGQDTLSVTVGAQQLMLPFFVNGP